MSVCEIDIGMKECRERSQSGGKWEGCTSSIPEHLTYFNHSITTASTMRIPTLNYLKTMPLN